jgi:hypothetical protein
MTITIFFHSRLELFGRLALSSGKGRTLILDIRRGGDLNPRPNPASLKNRSRALRTIGFAIWKAVVIDNRFRSLGGVDTSGDGDLASVTSAVSAWSQGASRQGGISFWGDFTATVRHEPNRPAPAFRIAVIGWGIGNCAPSRFPLP